MDNLLEAHGIAQAEVCGEACHCVAVATYVDSPEPFIDIAVSSILIGKKDLAKGSHAIKTSSPAVTTPREVFGGVHIPVIAFLGGRIGNALASADILTIVEEAAARLRMQERVEARISRHKRPRLDGHW